MSRVRLRSGLVRPVDPSLPSNRLAVIGTGVAVAAVTAVEWLGGDGFSPWTVVAVSGGVFLAWAIGREVDPDREASAAVAMGLALVAALAGPPAPGVLAAALIALRILAGTTGRRLITGDLAVVTIAAGYSASRPAGWTVSALLIIAIIQEAKSYSRGWGTRVLPVAAAGALGLALGLPAAISITATDAWWVISTLVVLGAIVPALSVSSETDRGDRLITGFGVTMARVASAAIFVGGAVLADFSDVAPVGAALAAVLTTQFAGRKR